ncbi:MAG: cellulose synthase complex periplasmic endoglucanase BcsZ [Terracidiphilus sp.]
MGFPCPRPRKRLLLIMALLTLTVSGGCRQGPWTLWNAYAARFIDAQGRVIDPQGGDRTTSEGQAYALFFALADNDRARFDQVLAWTQANLAAGDLSTHLPAWLWGKDKDGAWKTLDPNPASDADLWLAYTLVEGGRLWKNPAYTNIGRKMMAMIAIAEVDNLPGFGPMLIPGPVGFRRPHSWTLNPSYVPVFLLERMAVIDPAGPWQQVALNTPKLLRQSAVHGFALDWVEYVPGDGFYPARSLRSKDDPPPMGSYDAIRVYLWAGMADPAGKMRGELIDAVPAMGVYLANHDAPPEKVSDQGIPMEQDGPVGFSAAVLPYLRANANTEKTSSRQIIRLSKERDVSSGLYGKNPTYYDQNLVLFATGFFDGRFRFGPGGELKVEWART